MCINNIVLIVLNLLLLVKCRVSSLWPAQIVSVLFNWKLSFHPFMSTPVTVLFNIHEITFLSNSTYFFTGIKKGLMELSESRIVKNFLLWVWKRAP